MSMRKAAVATLLIVVAAAAAGLALWDPTVRSPPPTPLPAPPPRGAGVPQYLARVNQEMAFRSTQVEAIDPSWEAAETLATGTLDAAELDGIGSVRIASLGPQRRLILKDFDVTYASGLSLVLSTAARARHLADLQGVVQLGSVKSAAGRQSFVLPQNVKLEPIRSVALVSFADGVVVVSADLLFRQ